MTSYRIQKIITKFLINQASSNELDELEKWIKKPKNEKEFFNYVKTNYLIDYNLKKFNSNPTRKSLQNLIDKDKKVVHLTKVKKFMRYAAIFIGIIALTYFFNDYFFGFNEYDERVAPIIVKTNTIKPGTDKATLTLEDGSIITLEKGASVQTSNANSNGEEIIYESGKRKSKEIAFNFLTIPRGGQFYIVLSDGTQVWLNSESQLKYPVAFVDGTDRKVELVYGEAYFDVSPSINHNGSKFKVINNSQEVEVLGTEFNIKAYKDETNIYTTLIEGKVLVNIENRKQNLIPNQQSSYNPKTNQLVVNLVDVYSEICWKEGIFSFKNKSLKDIMKVISRWYDADIVFENKDLESLKFKGVLDKKQSIEEIMSIMKSTTISNYEIKDKTIILK